MPLEKISGELFARENNFQMNAIFSSLYKCQFQTKGSLIQLFNSFAVLQPPGLPDFSWYNIPKWEKQMTTKYK
jgi:hypothetical protein